MTLRALIGFGACCLGLLLLTIPVAADRSRYEGDCVFCWVDGSEPDMPIWSDAAGGWIAQPGDAREIVELDETFAVPAGENRVFFNKVLRIRPSSRSDIEVRGTLVLRSCLLLWDQTEHQQTRLRIKEGGTLQAIHSYSFSSNGYWVNWEFESGSTIRLNRFVGDPWTSICGAVDYEAINGSTVSVTFQNSTDGSVVRVAGAHHLWFEIFPPLNRTVDIAFAAKRAWSDWTIATMWPNTVVEVTDSYVYQRDISLGPGNHVTVRDTTDGFSLGWIVYRNEPGFIDCEIAGLGDPDSDTGILYDHRTWRLPCIDSSLTLINSRLERAWPTTWGNVHLVVRNSNLADPRVWDGPATYEIYDSTIDHAAAYRGGRMYLENCTVRYDIEVKGAGALVYGYGLSDGLGGLSFAVIEVDGGRYQTSTAAGVPW